MPEASPRRLPLELLSTADMAEADRLAIAGGIASLDLMEAAGRAVAEAAHAMTRPGSRIAVVCGPGNNGGDGFVAARHLMDFGHDVGVACLAQWSRLTGDAAQMARRWKGPVHPLSSPLIEEADLIVDALFGAGLTRPLDGGAAALVARINATGKPVLAIDLPSGVDGDTGEARGPAITAHRAVTFFRLKPGHITGRTGASLADVEVADIGIPERVVDMLRPAGRLNAPDLWRGALPVPGRADHKYTRGHVVVVSGPATATGAARLAARGALRIGAGLVTLASQPDAVAVNAAHATAVMIAPFEGVDGFAALLTDERRNAVVVGPGAGVGPATIGLARAALASHAGVVLDADALTSLASDPDVLFRAARERPIGRRPVLTPHEGEFKRLFPDIATSGTRLERAAEAARRSHSVVVLKSAATVIAEPQSAEPGAVARVAVTADAPAWLATAGSGDVLAGFIAGLMAQGMPAFEAAAAGVYMHGAAARLFGPGLIAEDLPETLPRVLAGLYAMEAG
ncbi:MAG: NAD(P)H-hydrate dehydratase [Hyphomicrobiaceae bacterium]|nr:NAD(P)H-hydrate dehydratase [Hyphomicrobiaceae bacterium]